MLAHSRLLKLRAQVFIIFLFSIFVFPLKLFMWALTLSNGTYSKCRCYGTLRIQHKTNIKLSCMCFTVYVHRNAFYNFKFTKLFTWTFHFWIIFSFTYSNCAHSKYFRHVILMSFFYCLGHMISRHISNENFGSSRYIFFFFKTHKFESDYHCVFFFFWHASHILPHIFPSLNFNTNIFQKFCCHICVVVGFNSFFICKTKNRIKRWKGVFPLQWHLVLTPHSKYVWMWLKSTSNQNGHST